MSNRHCIEKILEKQQGSPSPKSITSSDHTEITCADKIKSEERFSASKELPKSFTKEPYSSFTPVRYSRMKRCYCPDCLQPPETVPPSWLRRSPPPMFLEAEKHPRSSCFVNYSYGLAYDRRPLGSSPLSARPRHYGPGVTMGAPKRKKRHRTAFTPTQLLGLENSFEQNQYSVGEERKQLAEFLGLSETQIKVWYQNRRTKYKRIRKEAEEDAREADVSHGGYMKYEDAEREVDRNHEGYAKYDDAKREVGRNHGHYSNYESCYPYCPDERSEEHAHAYRYERRWAYHSPYIGRERARDHSDTELRIVL